MQIPKRKQPWDGRVEDWFCGDRVEHYLRLRTVDLEVAAFLVVGMLPEIWEGLSKVMWFDGPYLKSGGNDPDEIWGFMEDLKAQWKAAGGSDDGIDFRAFLKWVEVTFERPHWLDCEGVAGLLEATPAPPAPSEPSSNLAEASHADPAFPLIQGEWYEFHHIDRILPLKSAVQVALGLAPARTPLRWLNNQLVTEPSPDYKAYRWANNRLVTEWSPDSQSERIRFWGKRLEDAWRESGEADDGIEIVAFLDWVSQAFTRPEWIARAEKLNVWPPKEGRSTEVTPPKDEIHEWNLEKFGPETRPDALTQRLNHWLRYDTWSHNQAILILLGIDPDGASLHEGNLAFLEWGRSLQFLNGIVLVEGCGPIGELLQVQMDGAVYKVTHPAVDNYARELAGLVREMRDILKSGNHPERADFAYYLRWADAKGFAVNRAVRAYLEGVSLAAQQSPPPTTPKARWRAQDETILQTIKSLGKDPLALPPFEPGQKWIKADVWDSVSSMGEVFVSRNAFGKAWDRLRQAGEIKEVEVSSP